MPRCKDSIGCLLLLAIGLVLVPNTYSQTGQVTDVPIEIFQVPDLPLSVQQGVITKVKRGYQIKLVVANGSELRIAGLRYSIATVDSSNTVRVVANRIQATKLPAYAARNIAFEPVTGFELIEGTRLILMVEQVIAPETIWEVIQAKDALDQYAKGNYSVSPKVLRVPNQIDAPPLAPRFVY